MTKKAKIEVISRNVDAPGNSYLDYPYQHLFLLYTEQESNPLFINAGSRDGNFLTGVLNIEYGEYAIYYKNGKQNKDFKICASKTYCFSEIQVQDSSLVLFPKWQKMIAKANSINAKEVPYDIPFLCKAVTFVTGIGDAVNAATEEGFAQDRLNLPQRCIEMYLCNTINSNTVVAELLKEVKIGIKLPTYPDDSPVKAPGVNSVLDIEQDLRRCIAGTAMFHSFQSKDKEFNAEDSQANSRERLFDETLLSDAVAQAINFADRAVEAQRQMQEEGVTIPPSEGNYAQDALDIARYSNEILSRAGLLGDTEEGKDEL